MVERVSTGGIKSFEYRKGESAKLDEERKKDIREGYERYYERRAREKRNRTIRIIVIILIIIILVVVAAFLRS